MQAYFLSKWIKHPFTPSSITSRVSSSAYARTGVPQPIASNNTIPKVSVLDGNTKASALAMTLARLAPCSLPLYSTWGYFCFSSFRYGPSPTKTLCGCGNLQNSSKFFSFVTLDTQTIYACATPF